MSHFSDSYYAQVFVSPEGVFSGVLSILFGLFCVTPVHGQSFTEHVISDTLDGGAAVHATDIDDNGTTDVLATPTDSTIGIYKNDGSGTFSKDRIVVASDTTATVRSFHSSDVNSDGSVDFLTASWDLGRIVLYTNDGAGNFSQQVIKNTQPPVSSATDVHASDLNGDGDTDILASLAGPNVVAWYRNEGDGTFSEQVISDTTTGAYSVQAKDVDRDGDPDAVTAAKTAENNIAWYENQGGTFPDVHKISGGATGVRDAYAVDIDGDSAVDVLSASWDDDEIVLHSNHGGGAFTTRSIVTDSAEHVFRVHATDVTGNGHPDLLSASSADNKIALYKNDGSAIVSETLVSDSAASARGLHAADVDGDGATDILSTSVDDGKIAWYKQEPTPIAEGDTFETEEGSTLDVPAPGVLENDSDPNEDDMTAILRNRPSKGRLTFTGDGSFTFDTDGDFQDLRVGQTGVVRFDYKVIDDTNGSGQATVTIEVHGKNEEPVVTPDAEMIGEEATVSEEEPGVLENDSDPNGDILRVGAVLSSPDSVGARLTLPSGARAEIGQRGNYFYDPNGQFEWLGAGETARDTVAYKVVDGNGGTDTGMLEVTVEGVNDAPVTEPDADTSVERAAVTTSVLANDSDVDGMLDSASVAVVGLPGDGAVDVKEAGTVVYTPDSTFVGRDQYTYTVADRDGARSDTTVVTVTIEAVRPDPPEALRATADDQSATLRWESSPDPDVAGYRIYRGSTASTDLGEAVDSIDIPETSEYTVTGLTNRQEHYFFVTAVDGQSLESIPDTTGVVPRPTEIGLDVSVGFGSAEQTANYRMVGLPGAPKEMPFSSTLPGDVDADWTAYAAPGITSSDGLVAYREDSTQFVFEPGRGFWLLSEHEWIPEGAAAPVPLSGGLGESEGLVATIPLPEGWSVVTNPFPESVAWADVVAATPDFDGTLWGYEGSYEERSTLTPYEGYYLFNDPSSPIDTLRVPYPVEGALPAGGADVVPDSGVAQTGGEGPGSQGFLLRARREDGEGGAIAELRVGSRAKVGRDEADQFAPPPMNSTSGIDLLLHNEAVSESYPFLRQEGRPLGNDRIATYTMRLSGPARETVQLSADEARLEGRGAYLYDRQTEQVFNLRAENAALHFGGGGAEGPQQRSLEVWVGAPDRLEERRAEAGPGELSLSAPFPNPTRSTTRLTYAVPETDAPARVQITVYDVLGREVQRLVDGTTEAGRHVLRWDGADARGRDLASGVYLCRMTVDDKVVETRKITLVR